MTEREIITMDDIRRAGFCSAGVRRWFEAYGLDFRALLEHGIPVDTLLATGDGCAEHVVNVKREHRNG